MDDDRMARIETFEAAIQVVIDEHWPAIAPRDTDDDLDDDTIEELGATYASCWVLTVGVASIGNPRAPHLSTRYQQPGQSPFTGMGLLDDSLATWRG